MTKTVKELRTELERLMRTRGIRTLEDASGVVYDGRPFFTGYDYGRLYDWDQYFESILQLNCNWDLTCIQNSLIIFLDNIETDGHILRTLPRIWWGEDLVKPFLAQQAVLLLRAGDSLGWLRGRRFWALKKYLKHWLFSHDIRGAGLSVWDCAGHSGMDNQHERAGHFYDAYCEGVDLNAYLVRECEAYAVLAGYFEHRPEEHQGRDWAASRREAINRWLWDGAEDFYYDYHARALRPIRVKHVGVFATLWAGVPDEAQAKALVEKHLLNPQEFWREWPLPALAATEPGYLAGFAPGDTQGCSSWRAHTWIPTNYYAFQGLRLYGYASQAAELAERTRLLFQHNPFREYYDAESGAGWGLDPFWGWSGLALYMEEELERGTDPTKLTGEPGYAFRRTQIRGREVMV